MPIYEYYCAACQRPAGEELRPIDERNDYYPCPFCRGRCDLAISVPHAAAWNDQERFPNLSPYGDGTKSFESREAYNAHLKKLDVVEAGDPRHHGTPRTRFRKSYPTASPPEKAPPRPW